MTAGVVPTSRRSGGSPARRLLVAVPLAIVGFLLLAERVPELEAAMVAFAGGPLASTADHAVLVVPTGTHQTLSVRLSASCSALSIVIGCAVVAFGLLRAGTARRLVALLAGAAAGVALNTARIVAVILVGKHRGAEQMVLVHDWFGTAFTVVVAAACMALVLWVGTRSPRRARPAPEPSPPRS